MTSTTRPGVRVTVLAAVAIALALVVVSGTPSDGSLTTDVRGHVTDADGHPLAGAVVTDESTRTHARSAADGTFSLALPRGRRALVATRAGSIPQKLLVTIGGATPADFDLWEANARSAAHPNAASNVIFWVGCKDLVKQTDAELRAWKRRGVDGFVCTIGYLRRLGGANDFSARNPPPAGARYDLQRRLSRSRVVERARRIGIRTYLGFYAANYTNRRTPLEEWFDSPRWSRVLLPRLHEVAAAARTLGFAGLALDQELYGANNTASWDWSYPGNSHSEAAVRAQVRRRGAAMMRTLLGAFPRLELVAYGTHLPGTWEDHIQEVVNGIQDAFGRSVQIDLWNGITSVRGYSAIRWMDATFYKAVHVGSSWDDALRYNARAVYALLSRRFSNWAYAAPRLDLSPFAWIDRGPSAFERARPPAYVREQLLAFRRWGMGGAFANYTYRGLRGFDYAPYVPALRAASTPGSVDSTAPTIALTAAVPGTDGRITLTGTATDNFAVRWIAWRDDNGDGGVAQLVPDVASADGAAVTWTAAGPRLTAGHATSVVLRAEDIKGLSTVIRVSVP